jgi:hypothetical protein
MSAAPAPAHKADVALRDAGSIRFTIGHYQRQTSKGGAAAADQPPDALPQSRGFARSAAFALRGGKRTADRPRCRRATEAENRLSRPQIGRRLGDMLARVS